MSLCNQHRRGEVPNPLPCHADECPWCAYACGLDAGRAEGDAKWRAAIGSPAPDSTPEQVAAAIKEHMRCVIHNRSLSHCHTCWMDHAAEAIAAHSTALAQLEAARAALRNVTAERDTDAAEIMRLQWELAEARDALRVYGQHRTDCPPKDRLAQCVCGFRRAALALPP